MFVVFTLMLLASFIPAQAMNISPVKREAEGANCNCSATVSLEDDCLDDCCSDGSLIVTSTETELQKETVLTFITNDTITTKIIIVFPDGTIIISCVEWFFLPGGKKCTRTTTKTIFPDGKVELKEEIKIECPGKTIIRTTTTTIYPNGKVVIVEVVIPNETTEIETTRTINSDGTLCVETKITKS